MFLANYTMYPKDVRISRITRPIQGEQQTCRITIVKDMTSGSLYIYIYQWKKTTIYLWIVSCAQWVFSELPPNLILTINLSKDQHDISSGSVLNDLHLKAEVCTDKSQKDCRPLYLEPTVKTERKMDLVGRREKFGQRLLIGENDCVFLWGGRCLVGRWGMIIYW